MAGGKQQEITAPAHGFYSLTSSLSDTVYLPKRVRAIFVGGAGNVKVRGADTVSIETFACVAGTILPVEAVQVYTTGTTATLLIGLT